MPRVDLHTFLCAHENALTMLQSVLTPRFEDTGKSTNSYVIGDMLESSDSYNNIFDTNENDLCDSHVLLEETVLKTSSFIIENTQFSMKSSDYSFEFKINDSMKFSNDNHVLSSVDITNNVMQKVFKLSQQNNESWSLTQKVARIMRAQIHEWELKKLMCHIKNIDF